MPPPIVFDALRLFLNAAAPTPRGIDRVDFEYAQFFFQNWTGDCVATIATPWGARWYGRERVLRGLRRIEELWSERGPAEADQAFLAVKAQLGEPAAPRLAPASGRRGRIPVHSAAGIMSLLSQTGFSVGGSTVRSAPLDALYLNVGQLCWAMPWLVSWLRYRPDVTPVFMVHDVIPLERPDLVWNHAPRLHRMMMKAVARHASAVIVPTAAAREAILAELRRCGRSDISVTAIPHPVAPVFLAREAPDPDLAARDYFVVCGAVEPRKNHRLLFAAWEQLLAARGERAPYLVVAGRRGRAAAPIFAALAKSPALRSRMILAPDLSSPALRRLMAQAKALLMPSFAEGFGLPVIEALASGSPVIASDLAAHREAAGDCALYLDPHDERAWVEQICAFSDGTGAAPEFRRRAASYRPRTARDYFAEVTEFLSVLARAPRCESGRTAP